MAKKVLLVVPPCFLDREVDFEIGLPVHLALLGREAREQGWDVEYLDMTLEEKEGYDSFADLSLRLRQPDIVLVGVSNHTVRTSVTTQAVAEKVKYLRPDVQVVVGGVNATFMWQEMLQQCSQIDYILRGYAQRGFRGLLQGLDGKWPCRVSGLAYRRDGGVHTEALEAVSAKAFKSPPLDGLPIHRYLGWTSTYPLFTHAGCAFSCNFCTSVMPGPYQSKEVYRPTSDVLLEMKKAISLGFSKFFMSANVFTSQREYCLELCGEMLRDSLPKQASWVCMTRVEFVDEELFSTMRRAGCTNVAFGIEVATLHQWKSLGKGRFSKSSIEHAFRCARNAGVSTTAYLILGAPEQSIEDLEATLDLVRQIDPDYRVVSFFQPFPGTPYWSDYERYGLSELASLDQWNFHEGPVCRTRHFDKRDLVRIAVRLALERPGTGRVDPASDTLLLDTSATEFLSHAPPVVRCAFHEAGQQRPIDSILEAVTRRHGLRGRLLALHWFSAAIRDRVLRVNKQCDSTSQNQQPAFADAV